VKIYEIMAKIKCFILNRPYIPQRLFTEFKGPLLLHISDTPSDIYPYIKKLIEKINPRYIVHTGDMVDDIKLGVYHGHIHNYTKHCKELVYMLEGSSKADIYYVMGNHDNKDVVKGFTQRGHVLENGIIDIEDKKIYLNHYYKERVMDIDYYLFGHSFEPYHFKKEGVNVLNGILKINVIDLNTDKVMQLDYPMDTNRQRKMERGKIGL
jgi:predicted phosphodiesterase